MAARKTLRGLKKMDFALDKINKPLYSKYGAAYAKLLMDWEHIVGKTLYAYTRPKKLVFQGDKTSEGLLVVEVYYSSLATQMLFMEPVILEKISTYFGYKAVAKMKILQRPSAKGFEPIFEEKKDKIQRERQREDSQLMAEIEPIDDPELKISLQRLMQALI